MLNSLEKRNNQRKGKGDFSLLTLSSFCSYIGIVCLLLGSILAFVAGHTTTPPPTVSVRLGDSVQTVQKFLGTPQELQGQSLFDPDTQGYPHYAVQFTKNQHVYAMLRELWPEEQQDQTLSKQDCLAMLPDDARFINTVSSEVKGYPDAENYTSEKMKKVFAGYLFNAPAGMLEMIYHYRQVQKQDQGQISSTMQILACQVGMGKYTGNTLGIS